MYKHPIERIAHIAIALLLTLGFVGALAPLAYADEVRLAGAELPAAKETPALRPDIQSLTAALKAEMHADLEDRLRVEIAAAKPTAK